MSGAALAGVAAAVATIEHSADAETLQSAVRAFASPFGYDRFVIYTAPPPGDGAVDRVLWLEGPMVAHVMPQLTSREREVIR